MYVYVSGPCIHAIMYVYGKILSGKTFVIRIERIAVGSSLSVMSTIVYG